MSRVGKKLVEILKGVEVTIADHNIAVKGPKGELKASFPAVVTIAVVEEDGKKMVQVKVAEEEDQTQRALWGLWRALVANMVSGVATGFEKKLEIIGVGFKAEVKGSTLVLDVGFSHQVNFPLPAGVAAKVEKNILSISGADKQMVGEVAAQVRSIKKPEPYKGKVIKYIDEVIHRKAGKAAKTGAAAK